MSPVEAKPGQVRSSKTDKLSFETLGDKIRDKCVEMIYDSLAMDSIESELEQMRPHSERPGG